MYQRRTSGTLDRMHTHGHMIEVEYDGQRLTVTGTNKASRAALRGADHGAGPLILERADITAVDVKPPTVLANGRLTVHTSSGDRYLLHFRRKQAADFTELADALNA